MAGAERATLVRIAVVDDDDWARDRLVESLARFDGFEILDACARVDDLILGPGVGADLVILDVLLKDDPIVVENIARIRRAGPRVLLVSAVFDEESVRGALKAGAVGFQAKVSRLDGLVKAIHEAMAGQFVISQQAMMAVLNDSGETAPVFTRREVDVLGLYASGLPAKTVAKRLNISDEMVKEYVKRIRGKYRAAGRQVDTRMELYHAAIADGVLTTPLGTPAQDNV